MCECFDLLVWRNTPWFDPPFKRPVAHGDRPRHARAGRFLATAQRHAVLDDGDGCLLGAALLGELGKRRTTPVVKVPTGVAAFPKEIITPVRRWMEPNFHDITHWSEMEKGGHFAAFEQPELFVRDVRKFFATVR